MAEAEAEALVGFLRGSGRVVVAGSYRRRRDTVGDLDVLVTAKNGAAVGDRLVEYENVAEVLAHGPTRTTVMLRSGLQVDVRAVPEESYGAALLYFTGSKAHNIALRGLANQHGWKLNEYGLFSGKRRIAGATEEDVYEKLGLAYIAPELREDRGEIAASQGRQAAQAGEAFRYSRRPSRALRLDRRHGRHRRDGRSGAGARLRIHRPDRPQPPCRHDARPRSGASGAPDPRNRPAQREIQELHDPQGYRGRYPPGRQSRPAGFKPGEAGHRGGRGAFAFRSAAQGADRSRRPGPGEPPCVHSGASDRALDRRARTLRHRYGSP